MGEISRDPESPDYISFPPAKRGPHPGLWASVVRELTPEDVETIRTKRARPSTMGNGWSLTRITHNHHRLAQLLAQGHDPTEVALLTGYTPTYIYALRNNDPAFKQLLHDYGEERRQIFVDVLERMRGLGLSTLDELQARLAEEPAGFSNRDLMDMAEMLLIKPITAAKGVVPSGGGATPTIQINFVDAGHKMAGATILEGDTQGAPIERDE